MTNKAASTSLKDRRCLCVATLAALFGLAGCQEWQAAPIRVENAYGQANRALVNSQIYDPGTVRQTASLAPDGMEGQKADTLLQETYRDDVGSSERVRKRAQLGIRSSGSNLSMGGGNY